MVKQFLLDFEGGNQLNPIHPQFAIFIKTNFKDILIIGLNCKLLLFIILGESIQLILCNDILAVNIVRNKGIELFPAALLQAAAKAPDCRKQDVILKYILDIFGHFD